MSAGCTSSAGSPWKLGRNRDMNSCGNPRTYGISSPWLAPSNLGSESGD